MLFLSVTEAGEAGALDLVSTAARNRRIVAWRKTGPDLCVLSRVRRPDGRDESSASCDTHVGRRWPRIPFTRRNKPLNRAFPSRGGTIGDDCCGSGCHRLVTSGRRTRQPGRFPRAGSVCCVEQAQEASGHDVIAMSRWYQRGALGRRVRCVVSVNVNQSGARDAGGSGRLVVWFTMCCCAPVTVCARPFRVDRVGGGATARSW
jgi:hypothetical protein